MELEDRTRQALLLPRWKALAFFLASSVVLLAVLAAIEKRIHNEDLTGPFLVGDLQSPDSTVWPVPVAIQKNSSGYDGQFYLALAMDPLLRTRLVGTLDDPAYRARRITGPLAAWLLSGGNPARSIPALHFLNIVMLAAGATAIAVQAARAGRSMMWGATYLLSLGSVVCLSRGLVDGIMLSLLILALVASRYETSTGIGLGALLFALAVLQKETALLAFPAFVLGDRLEIRKRRVVAVLVALFIPFAWWAYVYLVVHESHADVLNINFTFPLGGFLEAVSGTLIDSKGPWSLVKSASFLVLHGLAIAFGICAGVSLLFSRAESGPSGATRVSAALFSIMGLFLAFPVWCEPWAYARTLLPIFVLLLWAEFEAEGIAKGASRSWTSGRILLGANCLAGLSFLIKNLLMRTP